MIKNIIELIRVKQWTKNGFLFLPAFFGKALLERENIMLLGIGFILFSLLSSSIYILNDYFDRKSDALHPVKKFRPLASGKIPVSLGLSLCIALCVISFVGAFMLNANFFIVLFIYFLTNITYSLGAKNFALVDIFLVSLGFVYRVIAGGILVNVVISKWLFMITFLLSLFLVVAKRRDDVILAEKSDYVRKASKKYNLVFINNALVLISSLLLMSYIIYTFMVNHMGENNYLIFSTSIFVILGVLRYYQIIFVENNSSNPSELLLKDRILQGVIVIWLVLFSLALYV